MHIDGMLVAVAPQVPDLVHELTAGVGLVRAGKQFIQKLKLLAGQLGDAAAALHRQAVISRYEEYKEEIANSDEVILEIPTEDVTSLSWTIGDESLAFHKDESWLYDTDEAFPVDDEKIEEMLSQFEEFGVAFIIENVEDYAQYGLDSPECTISIATAEQSYEIKLGDFSQMDEQRYVDIGDGNVYLVSTDPMDSFDVELSDLILDDEIPSFDNVSHITFAGAENYTVTYEENSGKSYSADDVYFNQQGKPLDSSLLESYLSSLSNVDLSEYVTYNATADELEEYGMNDPELTVTVDYSYTNVEDEETGDTSDITAYLRVGESQIIYKLSGDDFTTLMDASYDSLRHQQVFWGDFEDVTQIDITLEGESHTITSALEDDERVYSYNGSEIDLSDFTTALENLTADSFTSAAATGQEEISLTLHLDNEDFPTVTIQITRYDGSLCLASVDGESVSLVSRSDAMDLVEAVQSIVLGQSE